MCDAYKEAWRKVNGVKKPFWGALVSIFLILTAGNIVIGIILGILGYVNHEPNMLQFMRLDLVSLLQSHTLSMGVMLIALGAHLASDLFQMCILFPMMIGMHLITLKRVADKEVRASYIYKFIAWKYIWRFAILLLWISLMAGIPFGLGVLALMLPTLLHITLWSQLVVCNVGGLILVLLALYLIVGYSLVGFIVVDRNISAWQAMELSRKTVNKRWFFMLGTLIWLVIAQVIGALVLVIGLVWAMPYAYNVLGVLYRDMIGIDGKDPVSLQELPQ